MTTTEIAKRAVAAGALQKPGELAWLLDLVLQVSERPSILEIGCDAGGTLCAWREISDDVVGITLPAGPFSSGRELDDHGAIILEGDSHDPGTLVRLVWMSPEPFDLVFIDGDHTFDGVRADFAMYRHVSRGLVAFHDIAEHDPQSGCRVRTFWLVVCTSYPMRQRIDEPSTWGGIGVVRVP